MSTLFVNNLNTSSGTTITVPTGKKIIGTDAGSIAGTGNVVNVTHAQYGSGNSVSPSTSFVDTATLGTVTTTHANSKILVISDLPIQTQDKDCIWTMGLRSSIDSYASNLFQKHFVNYATNNHLMNFTGMSFLHTANQVAGTAITYKYYVKGSNTATGSGWYCVDAWGQSGFNFSILFLEIK